LYASELSSHLREEIDTSKLVTSANILSNLKVHLDARFLLRRFVVSRFSKSSKEVHMIFDNPEWLQNAPKYFEQKRDSTAKVLADHRCDDITSETMIPHKKWKENFINCQSCKGKCVQCIGNDYLVQTKLCW